MAKDKTDGRDVNMQRNMHYYQGRREEMSVFLPGEYDKVLEVGCGEANFTTKLKPNCEIWGVELNSDAAKIASKKMEKVLMGKFDQIFEQLPNCYFDLVICNDVIEHMEDHDAFFESIKIKMKSEAYLVVSIPNVRHHTHLWELLIRKDWNYKEGGILDRTHLRFFTEKSLKRTLNEHGFEIQFLKGINITKNNPFKLKDLLRKALFWIIPDLQFLQFGVRAQKRPETLRGQLARDGRNRRGHNKTGAADGKEFQDDSSIWIAF